MLIYDGIFKWEGPDAGCSGCEACHNTDALWLISCKLKIVDLASALEGTIPFKRHLVLAEDISEGPLRRICAESLGRRIFKAFNLDIRRTLWIEFDPKLPKRYHVAHFTPAYHDGQEIIYTIEWRPLMPGEKKLLHAFGESLF
ncbi:MAG: hypothetical protein MI742_05965 [Desulfobacterales bacterium]|nr:hypothetical protein [Desulfobacterales bacterium]